jgi:hypothetical protein
MLVPDGSAVIAYSVPGLYVHPAEATAMAEAKEIIANFIVKGGSVEERNCKARGGGEGGE